MLERPQSFFIEIYRRMFQLYCIYIGTPRAVLLIQKTLEILWLGRRPPSFSYLYLRLRNSHVYLKVVRVLLSIYKLSEIIHPYRTSEALLIYIHIEDILTLLFLRFLTYLYNDLTIFLQKASELCSINRRTYIFSIVIKTHL